ncbi:MAG: hypothetical protein ABIQ65_09210 [Thermoanaerobaculia bacterium]
MTEAVQVDDDEVFTALLQSRLSIPVINAGLSSRSPADYIVLAPSLLKHVHPTWTVIEVNAADLTDDGFAQGKRRFVDRSGVLEVQTPETVHLGLLSRTLARVRPHSALINYGIARFDMFRSGSRLPALFRGAATENAKTPAQPVVYPVERELDLMQRSYGSRVTFFFLPEFNRTIGSTEKRFISHCLSSRSSCVNLRVSFREFEEEGCAPFGFHNSRFGGGHMNAEGHRAAADLLSRELQELRRRGLF